MKKTKENVEKYMSGNEFFLNFERQFEFSSSYFEILRPFAQVGPVPIFSQSTQSVPVQQSVHKN
jgi:hypothetical protein